MCWRYTGAYWRYAGERGPVQLGHGKLPPSCNGFYPIGQDILRLRRWRCAGGGSGVRLQQPFLPERRRQVDLGAYTGSVRRQLPWRSIGSRPCLPSAGERTRFFYHILDGPGSARLAIITRVLLACWPGHALHPRRPAATRPVPAVHLPRHCTMQSHAAPRARPRGRPSDSKTTHWANVATP